MDNQLQQSVVGANECPLSTAHPLAHLSHTPLWSEHNSYLYFTRMKMESTEGLRILFQATQLAGVEPGL